MRGRGRGHGKAINYVYIWNSHSCKVGITRETLCDPTPVLSVHFRIVTLNAWLKPVDDLVSPQFLMMVQWKLNPVIKSIAIQSPIQVCKSASFRCLHNHAHSRTIHNSQGVELALVSICRRMDKADVVCVYD